MIEDAGQQPDGREDGREQRLLAMIDPFVALADGRRQLLEAIQRARPADADLAEILGIVTSHDRAMREIALAFADGTRDFATVAAPNAHLHGTRSIEALEDAMHDSRAALFEAIAAMASSMDAWMDEVIETPWAGRDTWRMHLVSLAMHEGAHAFAIVEASDAR